MDVIALKLRLQAAGCNPANYAINGRQHDAFCLEQQDGIWVVFYAERGLMGEVFLRTPDESEACAFFFDKVSQQQHWHLVGAFENAADAEVCAQEILALGAQPMRNDLPVLMGVKARYRVFVVGKDIFKVNAFKSPT